jgi:hypothetical protein
MATIDNTTVVSGDKKRSRLKTVTWEELGQGDDGEPVSEVFMEGTVHVNGTFGGASVLLQSGTGNNQIISISAAGSVGLVGPLKNFRPVISGGGGTTDIDIELIINS